MVLVYANSLDGAFILDDDQNIEDNRRIRSLDNLNEILSVGRPLVELSLALNYAYGELDPAGYHVFNILIHILVGLTLYGVVRRTLLLPRLRERFGTSSHWLALAIGLLWTVHPLTTQAVTYVIQRGESMGSLFYLLTLYCVIRGSQAKRPRRGYWYATAVISAGVGMACKAIVITAPALLLLYDRVFLSTSTREVLSRRFRVHLGVLLIVLGVGAGVGILQTIVTRIPEPREPSETRLSIGRAASPMEYYRTQPEILLHYLSLAYWPADLCLDYKWEPSEDLRRILVTSAAVATLLAATCLALWLTPALGFLAASIFVLLVPTFLNWRLELAFEHRMYLPLAALIALTIFVGLWLLSRLGRFLKLRQSAVLGVGGVAVLIATLGLGARTISRNEDYASRVSMYREIVRVRPQNPRAHYNLANPLSRESRRLRRQGKTEQADALLAEAIEQYEEAIRLFPAYLAARINLAVRFGEQGTQLEKRNRPREARKSYDLEIEQLREVVRIKPRHKIGVYNLGLALRKQGVRLRNQGQMVAAQATFEEAVVLY
ncbi:MAG: hypothetical protein IH800_17090, partial [Myxococcales bacterium]|nr:hypothetical protein [Myxococcales bacterium]